MAWAPAGADAATQAPDGAAPVRAADHVTLRWSAPAPECPDELELALRVRSLLGASPVQLDAVARVQQLPVPPGAANGWRLDLDLRWAHRGDVRTLYADDCQALADAAVVLVAVLAAPLFAAQRLAGARDWTAADVIDVPADALAATSSSAASTSMPEPALRGSPRSLDRGLPRRGPFMRIASALGYGALPRGDFGVTVAAGGLLPRLRLEAAATFLSLQGVSLPDGSGRGGTIGLAAVTARVCPRFLGPPVELSLCGALEAGVTSARSVGLTPPQRSMGPWLALGLGGALDWWFSPQVALHAGIEGTVAPVLTAYRLGDERLFTPQRLGVRAGLGLTIALVARRGHGARTRP